jgi:hypothetical protein
MDWIISDEYKLTVGNVLGHLAAAAMICGGNVISSSLSAIICRANILIVVLLPSTRYSSLCTTISSDSQDTRSRWILVTRLFGTSHRQHAENIFLVSSDDDDNSIQLWWWLVLLCSVVTTTLSFSCNFIFSLPIIKPVFFIALTKLDHLQILQSSLLQQHQNNIDEPADFFISGAKNNTIVDNVLYMSYHVVCIM